MWRIIQQVKRRNFQNDFSEHGKHKRLFAHAARLKHAHSQKIQSLNVTGMTVLNNFTASFGADAVAAMGIVKEVCACHTVGQKGGKPCSCCPHIKPPGQNKDRV